MEDTNEQIVPGEQDENVGGEAPKKKREKKKKSRAERAQGRRTVFILFITIFLLTMAFYLWPKISKGDWKWFELNLNFKGINMKAPEWRGYSEVEM